MCVYLSHTHFLNQVFYFEPWDSLRGWLHHHIRTQVPYACLYSRAPFSHIYMGTSSPWVQWKTGFIFYGEAHTTFIVHSYSIEHNVPTSSFLPQFFDQVFSLLLSFLSYVSPFFFLFDSLYFILIFFFLSPYYFSHPLLSTFHSFLSSLYSP